MVAGLIDNEFFAPMIYKDTMKSDLFEEWFEKMLIPSLNRKTIIILDNASFHRMNKLQEITQKYGHIILPLPPYSPELNPIEKCWANIKELLRKILPFFNNFDSALSYCFEVY